MAKQEKKLFVEREIYEKNGKEFYSYFIKGNVRGKDIKVLITPPDIGGFAVLDIVFGNEMKVDLVATPFEVKDDKTGNTFSGNTYSVRSVDENGEIYECKIKPFRSSDKSLLNMLMK